MAPKLVKEEGYGRGDDDLVGRADAADGPTWPEDEHDDDDANANQDGGDGHADAADADSAEDVPDEEAAAPETTGKAGALSPTGPTIPKAWVDPKAKGSAPARLVRIPKARPHGGTNGGTDPIPVSAQVNPPPPAWKRPPQPPLPPPPPPPTVRANGQYHQQAQPQVPMQGVHPGGPWQTQTTYLQPPPMLPTPPQPAMPLPGHVFPPAPPDHAPSVHAAHAAAGYACQANGELCATAGASGASSATATTSATVGAKGAQSEAIASAIVDKEGNTNAFG